LDNDDFVKHKWIVAKKCPSVESQVPFPFWGAQLEGCNVIIKHGRHRDSMKTSVSLGHLFYHLKLVSLHAWNLLFQVNALK
jgi:hypothetical protein